MNIHRMISLAVLCCGVAAASPAAADGGDSSTLKTGEVLFPGQRLVSDSCYYHLDMQADGNLVVYDGPGDEFWSGFGSAQQGGFRAFYNNDTYAILQTDGNFVEYAAGSSVAPWSDKQSAHDQDGVIWMQDDGNLVAYPLTSPGSNYWWQSNTVHGLNYGSPCDYPASKTALVENGDYSAGTNDVYTTSCTNSFVDCGVKCVQDAGLCQAWTWIPPDDGEYSCPDNVGKCWFKSNQPGLVGHSGAVTGLIETYMPSGY